MIFAVAIMLWLAVGAGVVLGITAAEARAGSIVSRPPPGSSWPELILAMAFCAACWPVTLNRYAKGL